MPIHLQRLGVEKFNEAILSSDTSKICTKRIQGIHMGLFTLNSNKIWLNNYFISRTLLNDYITTIAWGCAYSAEELERI